MESVINDILVLGGTGVMGRHVVQLLAKASDTNVFVTSRSDRTDMGNIKYIKGNAHDISFLFPVLESKRWKAIVDFMDYASLGEFRERMAMFLENTEQYVFFSSSRVYADSQEAITEKTMRLLDVCQDKEFLSQETYALTKARCEDLLLHSGKCNWTILRPYIIFGEEQYQLGMFEKEDWLYRAIHGRDIVVEKDVYYSKTSLTYGLDAARCIAAIIGQEGAYGEIFQIATNEVHTWKEIVDVYLDVVAQKTGKRVGVKLTDDWKPWHGGYEAKWLYDRRYDRVFNSEKIGQYIPLDTFTPTLDAIKSCLSRYIERKECGYNWAHEWYKDKETNLLSFPWEMLPTWKKKLKYILFRMNLYKI